MSDYFVNREKLVDLEYSLDREIIRSNIRSTYSCSTLIGCNTRKYHGLFIVPQPLIDNENHVLLSSLDETIYYKDEEFQLGVHQYPNEIHPKGYQYLESFSFGAVAKHEYRMGSIKLQKEVCFLSKENRVIIRYTSTDLKDKQITLQLRPFLAFRQIHHLSKANSLINTQTKLIENGVVFSLYDKYTPLYIQSSKKGSYIHQPDWYYNVEYIREKERGYDYLEDLFVPGYFEFTLRDNETLCISIGTEETNPYMISQNYSAEVKRLPDAEDMEGVLKMVARTFVVKHDKKTEIIAGFPWFGRWGRDTFIALPGLMMANNDTTTFKQVIDTMLSELEGPLFPNMGITGNSAYNSVDASLWFFWALQQYAEFTGTKSEIWEKYGKKMKMILEGYRNGTEFSIHMTEDGLIYAGQEGKALTWMDAVINGVPVTPRIGKPVDINALWYNAIMFSLEVAGLNEDKAFIKEWEPLAKKIPDSFKKEFWDKDKGWLADVVNGDYKDFSIRPNMIFAASLPYTPLSLKIRQLIVEKVKKELLTPRGLRTLSLEDKNYKEYYYGNQEERDRAYHQGTVWAWLIGHFAEAYLKVYGKSGIQLIQDLYDGFEDTLYEAGIGSISEIFDATPPHKPRGAISQAWSVAEVLRMKLLVNEYSKEEKS